jgi:hypothetical protein
LRKPVLHDHGPHRRKTITISPLVTGAGNSGRSICRRQRRARRLLGRNAAACL